jgi:hypothetical protein
LTDLGTVRTVQREDDSKADASISVVMGDLVPLRYRTVNRPIVKASTPKDTFLSGTDIRRPIVWNVYIALRKNIVAPLPDVS